MPNLLNGIVGSKGYCTGNAVVKVAAKLEPTESAIIDATAEIERFREAQRKYDSRLEELAKSTEKSVGAQSAEIFRAYQHIVRDEAFFKTTFARVVNEKINIEFAIDDERKKLTSIFESMDDEYLRERATDIENVCNELIRIMLGIHNDFLQKLTGKSDVILVAGDLTPAEVVRLDRKALRGIIMEHGGMTSHTVLIAKALGIPAIIGVKSASSLICDGDYLQVDGFRGEIEIDPSPESKAAFSEAKKRYDGRLNLYELAKRRPAVTKDGFAVNVCVNSGDPSGTRLFDPDCCDGIGLFRTEFIYMGNSTYPDEETQFEIYKDIAIRAKGKDVIIRTLDIGGDKQASYMNLPRENNPVLGFRSIRLCLGRKDIFAVQLRAILRASVYGNIKIMFPMIVGVEELEEAKTCLEIEKLRLSDMNVPFREDIEVGAMIETPSAVMLSDKLAKDCDFFSVGSNDLVQYVTATDRMNESTLWLHDNCNVSVLRCIRIVAENAAKAKIPWSICGEVASESRLVPLWVAMGVRQLSVVPSHIGEIKHLINAVHRKKLYAELYRVFDFDRATDVKAHLDSLLARIV